MTPPTPLPPPGAIVVDIDGPIARADAPALHRLLQQRLATQAAASVICDVGRLAAPDLATVAALARLQLLIRRLGGQVLLRRASAELVGLLALTGLAEVLPLDPSAEPQRQAEQREQRLHVEEGVDGGDAAV